MPAFTCGRTDELPVMDPGTGSGLKKSRRFILPGDLKIPADKSLKNKNGCPDG